MYKIANQCNWTEKLILQALVNFEHPIHEILKKKEEMLCLSCFCDYTKETSYSLSCNHSICKECFQLYAKSAIESGIKCVTARCPGGCDLLLTLKDYLNLC